MNKLIIVITLTLAITTTAGRGTILYEKTWSTNRGSELKIEVTPDTANFQPKKVYSYTIIITAVKFGTDVDRLHEIRVYLQFLNAQEEIYTISDNYYEISNIGSSIQVVISLIIPSDSTLMLEPGEALHGKLQIKVDWKEGVVWAIDPSYSTGWETIADGKISVPSNYSTLIILGASGLIIGGGITGYYYHTKSKKELRKHSYKTIQSNKQFCPNCGKAVGHTAYCPSCGAKLSQ